MGNWRHFAALAVLVSAAFAADQPATPPATNCANGVPGAPPCMVSPQTQREARKAFEHGMKLQKEKRLEDAFEEFERAATLVPKDVQYATLRELTRQELVYEHLQRGNAALADGQQIIAMAEFRNVLHIDPHNDFAEQRLYEAVDRKDNNTHSSARLVDQSDVILVMPRDNLQSFHFRGDSRQLLTQVAAAYGITATFDDSVATRQVRFNVDNVGFYLAMQLAGAVTKTFWVPLESHQIIVATESAENHRLYDRMGLRTFYIPDASTQQELQDISNVLRTVFEIKNVTSSVQASTITVRGSQNLLIPASQFMESLGSGHPEVMLDVRVYEVSRTLIHNVGLHIPNQFNLFTIGALLQSLNLGAGQSIQDQINQLIASGGINQANSTAISALLAQSSATSSILSQPVATFGGGLTFMGVSLGTLSAQLSRNESQLRSLQHVTLRAAQGKDANINLGSRYPIINSSFAPIFNTSAISRVIGNNSYIAPVPSYTYEDIGLTMKVKPVVHGDTDVSLNIELKVRALTGASANGVPVIGNREYTGSINVRNEQSAVIAGQVTTTEQRSLSGIPGIGQIPVLSRAAASNSSEKDEDEMLVVVTPHIIRMADTQESEIWMTGVK